MIKKVLISIVALCIAFIAGRYSGPKKVEIKEVQVVVEKEVIKFVEKKSEDKNIIKKKTKLTLKDGSTLETEEEQDLSKTNSDTAFNSEKDKINIKEREEIRTNQSLVGVSLGFGKGKIEDKRRGESEATNALKGGINLNIPSSPFSVGYEYSHEFSPNYSNTTNFLILQVGF